MPNDAPCPRCNRLTLLGAAEGHTLCGRCGWSSEWAPVDLGDEADDDRIRRPNFGQYEYYFAPAGRSARQDAARDRGGAAGSAAHKVRTRLKRRLGK